MRSLIDDDLNQCRALVRDYHRAIDSGRATAGIAAFDEAAEFEVRGRTYRGRDEILEFLTAREADTGRHTVHVIANETVTAESTDEVRLRSLVLLHVRRADGGYLLDRVLDTAHELRRGAPGWRITRRTSTPLHPTA